MMKVNEENKKLFDSFVKDYKTEYADVYKDKKQLDKFAHIFAVSQLIYEKVKNKDFKICYGGNADDVETFDVILPCDTSNDFKNFAVAMYDDGEEFPAVFVKRGDNGIESDKLWSYKYWI